MSKLQRKRTITEPERFSDGEDTWRTGRYGTGFATDGRYRSVYHCYDSGEVHWADSHPPERLEREVRRACKRWLKGQHPRYERPLHHTWYVKPPMSYDDGFVHGEFGQLVHHRGGRVDEAVSSFYRCRPDGTAQWSPPIKVKQKVLKTVGRKIAAYCRAWPAGLKKQSSLLGSRQSRGKARR